MIMTGSAYEHNTVSGATNTKDAFRRHLSEVGFLMDQPPPVVMQELARHMGLQRFAECRQIMAGAPPGEELQSRLYDFMRDLREANLLRSLSPDVTLDTSYYLYEKAVPLLTPGKRVLELGCWTGGLVSFIAGNHPDCVVVGVDRARRILELNRAHYKLPNLRFELWDYRVAKPEALPQADVLLCSLGTNNDCPPGMYTAEDSLHVRASKGYQREKDEAFSYFVRWREAASDDAMLLSVLRVITFPRFLAFVDASQESGWTALLDRFAFVACPSNKEAILSLVFAARSAGPIHEDAILSHWMAIRAGNQQLAQLVGPSALGLYRSLGEKQVLAKRDLRNSQGLVVQEELGICGSFGYIYGQDPLPNHRLVLMSIAQAESQRHGFAQTANSLAARS